MNALLDFLKGKWLRHPLHPILAHIPVAAWTGTLIFDLLSRAGLGGNAMVRLSFYCIAIGLGVSLLAVLTGLADWREIKKEKPAWKIGLYHMALNLLVAVIFSANLGVRVATFRESIRVEAVPASLSAVGVLLLIISAYLGGLMIYDHGIGVARQSKKKWRRVAEASGANVPPEKG